MGPLVTSWNLQSRFPHLSPIRSTQRSPCRSPHRSPRRFPRRYLCRSPRRSLRRTPRRSPCLEPRLGPGLWPRLEPRLWLYLEPRLWPSLWPKLGSPLGGAGLYSLVTFTDPLMNRQVLLVQYKFNLISSMYLITSRTNVKRCLDWFSFSLLLYLNSFSQYSQWNGFARVWIIWCWLNLAFVLNDFPQVSHLNGFISLCISICWVKFRIFLPQIWHSVFFVEISVLVWDFSCHKDPEGIWI